MAKAKKVEETQEEVKKVSPKAKAKKAAPAPDEGSTVVTLKDLCEERGILPRDARIQLRRTLERAENARWEWEEDDKELSEVEALLDEYLERKNSRAEKEEVDEAPAPKAKAAKAKAKRSSKKAVVQDEDEDEDEDD